MGPRSSTPGVLTKAESGACLVLRLESSPETGGGGGRSGVVGSGEWDGVPVCSWTRTEDYLRGFDRVAGVVGGSRRETSPRVSVSGASRREVSTIMKEKDRHAKNN